jgi:3-isopropylmalate dehydratase small subunit
LVPEAVDCYHAGDPVSIDFAKGTVRIKDKTFRFEPLPEKLMRIFEAKGLVNYIKMGA